MARAIWNGRVLAESHRTVVVENRRYFPPLAINREYFEESDTRTTSRSKGEAVYYDVIVDGRVNDDAAWYHPDPPEANKHIAGFVAFGRGVVVED